MIKQWQQVEKILKTIKQKLIAIKMSEVQNKQK